MKLNWGNSIALVFIVFMVFILQFVVRAFYEDFDLVSETYYKDEINYQQRMNDQVNLMASGQKIGIQQENEYVSFSYPELFKNAKGEIHFFHVSKTIFDRKFDIVTGLNGQQLIAKTDIVKGNYRLKLDWEIEGETYYQEEDIYIR